MEGSFKRTSFSNSIGLFYKAMAIKCIRKEDKMENARLFSKSRKTVEINSCYHVPDLEFLKICVMEGVTFSVGRDAYRLVDVGT
jgi:histidinol phosphatase-like PHP family hydrolase